MKPWIIALAPLTALLTAPSPALTATEDYGRVFFTPQDRVLLDDARRRKERALPKVVTPRPAAVVKAPPAKPDRPSGNVTLNGIVRRSDGEATIWINGVAMPADAQTGKVQVAPTSNQSGVIHVPNTESADNVELKVGQKLDLSSGKITERYVNRDAPRAGGTAGRSSTSQRPTRRPARVDLDTPENQ